MPILKYITEMTLENRYTLIECSNTLIEHSNRQTAETPEHMVIIG